MPVFMAKGADVCDAEGFEIVAEGERTELAPGVLGLKEPDVCRFRLPYTKAVLEALIAGHNELRFEDGTRRPLYIAHRMLYPDGELTCEIGPVRR